MRALLGLVAGALVALAIACGGGAQRSMGPQPPPPGGARAEIDQLDRAIADDMATLAEPRPAPAADVCVENCGPAPMSGAATKATAPDDPTCKPANTDTCSQSCTLKGSICTNAGKICTIAANLGGNDAYANEKCNNGLASCEAAKKRCCSCI